MYFDGHFSKTLTSLDFLGEGGVKYPHISELLRTLDQYMYLSKMHNFSSNVPGIFVTNILESSSKENNYL